jgi:hypothetical protein
MWTSLKNTYYDEIANHSEIERPIYEPKYVDRLKKASALADRETQETFKTYVKREILNEVPNMISTVTADICDECGVQMMVIANDSMLACSRCAKTRLITTANAWTSTMDVDFSNINNHQKSRILEWLEFAQAKEYGEIPNEVIKTVMDSLVANKATGLEKYIPILSKERRENGPFIDSLNAIERLRDKIPDIEVLLKQIDGIAIRNIIRNTAYKKFGDRSARISSIISGFWPERLSANQEEYIRKLFMAASPVYDRWRKTSQPVWPGGYAYFLRCILILLGWDEFAALFPIQVTGRNQERESMRTQIWAILKWSDVPSAGQMTEIKCPNGTILNGSLIAAADKKCKVVARGYDEL